MILVQNATVSLNRLTCLLSKSKVRLLKNVVQHFLGGFENLGILKEIYKSKHLTSLRNKLRARNKSQPQKKMKVKVPKLHYQTTESQSQ